MRRTLAVALFSATALFTGSCGSPVTPSGGSQPQTTEPGIATAPTRVAPLEVHKKPRAQAVVLGTGPDGASTAIPLAEDTGTAKVDVMWVKTGKPMVGGSSPVVLSTEPQSDGAVRVGIFEQFEGGFGAQSRSSVWIASFLSASTLGHDMTDFRFSAEVGGFVDGPSAGALYTAGFLASLTGTPVNSQATMTGTVNPDGTVGPVAGIPQKFTGSIQKGKKLLGYPIGSRYAVDANTKKAVDLHTLARSQGAEAREIRDIYDAFKLMTGKTLPRPIPLPATEMKLEPQVEQAYAKRFAEWKSLRGVASQNLGKLATMGRLPPILKKLVAAGNREVAAAEAALQQKQYATAYARNLAATVYLLAASELWVILEHVRGGDITSALARVHKRVLTLNNTGRVMEDIAKRHPGTIGGHLLMISAFQKSTAAVGFAVWGLEGAAKVQATITALRNKSETERNDPKFLNDTLTKLLPLMLHFTRGEVAAIAAKQALEIEGTETIDYSCSEPAARKLAKSYSSAALANLRYFESMMLKQIGKQTGKNREFARSVLGKMEPDYVIASTAMRMSLGRVPFIAKLKEKWGEESLAWSLHSLSGSILSYFKSSVLISRWYSLAIKRDRTTGKAISVKNRKAFIHMLESAERTAREYAHSAKIAVGHVPVQARIAYQRAKVLQSGNIDDKMRALEGYWASSSFSQTAVVMARHVINPAKHGEMGR